MLISLASPPSIDYEDETPDNEQLVSSILGSLRELVKLPIAITTLKAAQLLDQSTLGHSSLSKAVDTTLHGAQWSDGEGITGEQTTLPVPGIMPWDADMSVAAVRPHLPNIERIVKELGSPDGIWLCDEVIRAWVAITMDDIKVTDKDPSECDFGFVGPSYEKNFRNMSRARRVVSTKPPGFNAKKCTLVIINPEGLHWALLKVDNETKTVYTYEPNIGLAPITKSCAEAFIELCNESFNLGLSAEVTMSKYGSPELWIHGLPGHYSYSLL
jgi:hypothetical protein